MTLLCSWGEIGKLDHGENIPVYLGSRSVLLISYDDTNNHPRKLQP